MSDETHSNARKVREGAAQEAPTAPHATEPARDAKRRRTGPERFWRNRRALLALAVCGMLSFGVHYALAPWSLLPSATLHLHDSDDDLAIPVDLIASPAPPPTTPPPSPVAAPPVMAKGEGPGHGAIDGGPRPIRDAGLARDAAARDAAIADGSVDAADRGPADASGDGAVTDAMSVARGGVRDGGGALEGVASGPAFVKVAVNVAVIRTNPVGAHLGPLLRAVPQWDEFMAGTDVDPVKDVDWIYIFGPGLLHTEKDAVLVHYNMPDTRAAANIALLSKKDVNGGAWDAGVRGVKAWRGHADRAWRIFMLPQPGLAVMVPPEFAPKAARAFSLAEPAIPFRAEEAVRFTVQNASHALQGQVPDGLGELRLWVVPRADGGADAYAEIDAPDADKAEATARRVRQLARDTNSFAVKLVTRGVLDSLEVTSDAATMRAHLTADQDQLAALYDLVAAFLGVSTPPIASSLPPARSAPERRP